VAIVVAQHTGISMSSMRSRERTQAISQARRIAMLAWRQLGRPLVQMSNFLGISQSAGVQLIRHQGRQAQGAKETAIVIAEKCRNSTATGFHDTLPKAFEWMS